MLAYAGIPAAVSVPEFRVVDASMVGDWGTHAASAGTLVIYNGIADAVAIGKALVAAGRPDSTPVAISSSGTTTEQYTVVTTLGRMAPDLKHAGMTEPALIVVGEAVGMRERLSWFETKPLFGWRVLVPRTKEQSAGLVEQLRSYGAVPEEVPTISVEPPRTPQQMDRAIKGLVTGRYEWVAFTSANAVKAVREKFEEYGLDARAFAGLKVAAVGEATARALVEFGVKPDLVPTGEQSSEGLLAEWPPYDSMLDPINRVLLPRADIATEALVAGLTELGWECDDVTAYRTVRAAPPPEEIRNAIKGRLRRGAVHLLQHGAQPRRHRRQAAQRHGDRRDRPADRQDGRGAQPPRRRDGGQSIGFRPRRRARRVWCEAASGRPGGWRGAAPALPDPPRGPPSRQVI
nr:hypothetical protein GCM10020093_081980 [Planobispora longispora]